MRPRCMQCGYPLEKVLRRGEATPRLACVVRELPHSEERRQFMQESMTMILGLRPPFRITRAMFLDLVSNYEKHLEVRREKTKKLAEWRDPTPIVGSSFSEEELDKIAGQESIKRRGSDG